MEVLPVSPASAKPVPASAQKIKAAAQEFEGLLLASLLKDFKLGLGGLPGQECLGVGAYGDFASEALAGGLAAAGGVGLADLLVTALGKPK